MSKKTPFNAYVSAVGHYFPEKVITNKHFESYLDTTDDWIRTRTGISERRYLEKDQPTSYAAVRAARMILEKRGISAKEIDLIIITTVTPDMFYPSTAARVQNELGAKCWGFDLSAACSGFIFGLNTAAQFIENGTCKKVLLIGADKMSSIANMEDRNTCVLFGDGAAGFLLEPTEDKTIGVMDALLHMDGSGGEFLCQPGGGSLNPPTHETVDKKMHFVHQEGKVVFREAVKGMADISVEIMEKNGLTSEDVAFLVPHQANLRIIQATADRMGVSLDKVMININKYGNTTSCTIPSCISEHFYEGKVKKGDNLILSSFGAGFTWGSILLKWAI
ncbi:MAG: ketoacyl-ACP synthase III [Ignavibacteria bacterium]|nr:ketoacyl-ACP synthase III [Ignavibacteria bacterium]